MSGRYIATPARAEALRKLHEINRDSQERAPIVSIVQLMCEGLCDKIIARRLKVAVSTVKQKRFRFMHANNIKSRTQLGAWAVENGYYRSGSCPRATSQSGLMTRNDPAAAGEGAGL